MPSLCVSVMSPFMHTLFSLLASITTLLPRNQCDAMQPERHDVVIEFILILEL